MMGIKDFITLSEEFVKGQNKMNSIKPGDLVYDTDGYDWFECEVISIDLYLGNITVWDRSYSEVDNNPKGRKRVLHSFYTKDQIT